MTTVFLLYHVFDYKEEIHLMTNEIWQQNQELLVPLTPFMSSWYSSLAYFITSHTENDTDVQIHIDADTTVFSSTSNQTLFEIYDMNHIPFQCKEMNSLSLTNSHSNACRNILSNQMKQSFQQNGVIAIRGLLSNELFHQLNESSYKKLERHLLETGIGKSGSSGKQFLMNPMGLIFTNDDDDSGGGDRNTSNNDNNSNQNQQQSPSSGFRNVALSSLIPQVVSELIYPNSDNENENNYDENLRLLRYVVMQFMIPNGTVHCPVLCQVMLVTLHPLTIETFDFLVFTT